MNTINDYSKLDYERHCNVKFDLFDANDYLESNNDCMFNRNMTSNECNYVDVKKFLQLSDLNENNKKLITIFLNIRSVSKNLDEFVHDFFVSEKQYDVLCFAETRLTEAISPLFQLDGYIMYSCPRNCHGGGVVLYINRSRSSTRISDVTLMQSEIECVFANMVIRDEKYILGCVYRPPHSNIQSFLEKYESILSFLRDRF